MMIISPSFNFLRAFSNLYTLGLGFDRCPIIECTPNAFQSTPLSASMCCNIEANGASMFQ